MADDEKDAAFLCVPGMTHCNAFCHTDTHKEREKLVVQLLACHAINTADSDLPQGKICYYLLLVMWWCCCLVVLVVAAVLVFFFLSAHIGRLLVVG